jgi:hypothetical protein
MRHLLACAFLALIISTRENVLELEYAPEEGSTLRRTFVAEAEFELTDLTASVDGEALERGDELPPYSTRFTEHIAVLDRLERVVDGRAHEFTRTFEKLLQENGEAFGEDESESELESPLEGLTVRFRYDEDGERYRVEADESDELDEGLLDALAADMDLLLLLPGREVEVGDEWDVAPELYLAFMWPSGLLDFHAEGEEVGGDERAMSLQTIERLAGTGSARLDELREEDGVRVAVIHLELEITTGSERELPASEEEERPALAIEVEIERAMEGTVLWDLEHGHALSAELECRASRLHAEAFTVQGERDGEPVEADVERARLLEGTIRYSASIERVED